MAWNVAPWSQSRRNGARYISAPPLPASTLAIFVALDQVRAQNRTGTGNSLTVGTSSTFTCAAGAFVAADAPQRIRFSGWANAQNNQTCDVDTVLGGTQLRVRSTVAFAAETNANATWELLGKVSSLTDRKAGLVATPSTLATSLSTDLDTNGKLLCSAQVFQNGVVQRISAVDAVKLAPLNGNVPVSLVAVGKRLTVGGLYQTAVVGSLMNAANTRYVRPQFSGTNIMRMQRNDGTNDSTNIATNALIANNSMRTWAWTWNNTASGELQAYRDAASLAAPVAPSSKRNPVGMDTLTIGAQAGVSAETFTWRVMAWLASYATVAEQQQIRAYSDFMYL